MRLYDWLAILYHLHGCKVWEDLSALCGVIVHSVPW